MTDPHFYLMDGKYTIQETKNGITNTSIDDMSASGGISFVTNANGVYTFDVNEGSTGTITGKNTDIRSGVQFTKYGVDYYPEGGAMNLESAKLLPGAKFAIYTSEEDAMSDVGPAWNKAYATAVSNDNGVVSFIGVEVGNYWLREIEAPGKENDYVPDRVIYFVVEKANEWSSPQNGQDGPELDAIYNKENRESIFFKKWLVTLITDPSGVHKERIAISEQRLEDFVGAFKLQRKDENGDWKDIMLDDSGKWVEGTQTVGLARMVSGDTSMGDDVLVTQDMSYHVFAGLPVLDEEGEPYWYRVVENVPDGYKATPSVDNEPYYTDEDPSGNSRIVATTPFTLEDGLAQRELTNTTSGEISVEKWYYEVSSDGAVAVAAGTANENNKYPIIEAILCTKNADGRYVKVESRAVEYDVIDGSARSMTTFPTVPLLDEEGQPIAYYWAEKKGVQGAKYTLEGSDGLTTPVYDADGTTPLEGEYFVDARPVYGVAYDSKNNPTKMSNILPYRRITISKLQIWVPEVITADNPITTGTNVKAHGYLVRVETDENGNEIEVPCYSNAGVDYTTDGFDFSSTYRYLEVGYKYRLYEDSIPEDYIGPKNRTTGDWLTDENGERISYIDIDLTNIKALTENDVRTSAGSFPMYNEKFRPVRLEKWLYRMEGGGSLYNATFDIYVSDTEDGPYTKMDKTFVANTDVYLEPHKYYRLVEVLPDDPDIVDPELVAQTPELAGGSAMSRGGKFRAMVNGEEKELFGFTLGNETSGRLDSANSVYNLGVLNNYENLGNIIIKKIIAGSNNSPLEGAGIEIYTKDADGTEHIVQPVTPDKITGVDGNVESIALPVYDKNGNKIQYYYREVGKLSGYFENNEEYAIGDLLIPTQTYDFVTLPNEPEVTVNVQTTWEDCFEKQGQSESGSEGTESYYQELEGATVAVYKKVYDSEDKSSWHYELVDVQKSSMTDESGGIGHSYATFEKLSRKEEYVFVLASSGKTFENQDQQKQNYPLYASEDGSLDYLIGEKDTKDAVPDTLTEEQLADLSYRRYQSAGETEYTFDTRNNGNLNNHLLYFQLHVLKYCILWDEHGGPYLYDGLGKEFGALINGSTFTIYRRKLTDEELAKVQAGETLEIEWNNGNGLEAMHSGESGGGGGTGEIEFDKVTYGDCYVYWLVETTPGTAHGFLDGETYYRVLLYADSLKGSVHSDDATINAKYTKNRKEDYEVPNTHGTGSGTHVYFRTYMYMNKWQGGYDQYGEVTDELTPLGGASFKFGFGNMKNELDEEGNILGDDDGVWLALFDGGTKKSMSAQNSLGYLSPGAVYYADLFKMFIEAVTGQTMSSLLAEDTNLDEVWAGISADTWDRYSDMIFAARSTDVKDKYEIVDLATGSIKRPAGEGDGEQQQGEKDEIDGNGALALDFLKKYKHQMAEQGRAGQWSTGYMEEVMNDEGGEIGEAGWLSFYAHVVFREAEPPADYLLNEEIYHLYVGFEKSGPNGRNNTKYFYLDREEKEAKGEAWYYENDPVSGDKDTSLDNEIKAKITNLPDPENDVVITKYGYELNEETVMKTDDDLEEYFNSGNGSLRTPLKETEFVLQRFDSTANNGQGEWKYYTYDSDDKIGSYVEEEEDALHVETNASGMVSLRLPIGWYRVFEKRTGTLYEKILDGSTIYEKDGVTGHVAARYFYVLNVKTGNSVSAYNPMKASLTIQKQTLSDFGEGLGGIQFTLTNLDDETQEPLVKTTAADGRAKFEYIPAGRYLVEEYFDTGKLTGVFFKPFEIEIGYEVLANEKGEPYITQVVRKIQEDAWGANCAYDRADDIFEGDDGKYASALLTVHNPRLGELTITKRNAMNDAIISAYVTKFNIYYHPFRDEDFSDNDSYVVRRDATPPAFDEANPDLEENGWVLFDNGSDGKGKATIGGKIFYTNMMPGWYAAVEVSAPTYYSKTDAVIQYVRGDMTEEHQYVVDEMNVYDLKRIHLSVRKNFNLADFFSQYISLVNKSYRIKYGLYVRDAETGEFYNAYDLGLTTTSTGTITITPRFVNGQMAYDSNAFSYSVTQMGEVMKYRKNHLDPDLDLDEPLVWEANGQTYKLDKHYYLKEETIYVVGDDGVTEAEEVSYQWFETNRTYSYNGTKALNPATENLDGSGEPVTDEKGNYYFDLGIYQGDANASVTFTNTYGYAQVVIQKTGNNDVALSGASFTVMLDGREVPGVNCVDNRDGSYTITIPMQTTERSLYQIFETTPPDHYTLNDEPLEVELQSGDIRNFGSYDGLIMTDSNGANIYLIKYDNIRGNPNLHELNGVKFKLYQRERNDENASWGPWVERYEGETGYQSADGVIVFDTVNVDPKYMQYALVETEWNEFEYEGVESVYHNNTELTTIEQIQVSEGKTLPGYIIPITELDIGTNYSLRVYNKPYLKVKFRKTSADNTATPPTAQLWAYKIPDSYAPGTILTEQQIADFMVDENHQTWGTTAGKEAVSGQNYSTVTLSLPIGTYLVVEMGAQGGTHVIDKEDTREVWYQIVRIEAPDDGKDITIEQPFVNVQQNYTLRLTKTGDTQLAHSLLEKENNPQRLRYGLTVSGDNTGPLKSLTVTENGLKAISVYGEDAMPQGADYLNGHYTITQVSIPTNASYNYSNLVFTSGNKDTFTPAIRAKVTFTYADQTTEEQSISLSMAGTMWNVSPSNTNKKAIGFTVEWYDTGLETATGYKLGANFSIGSPSEIGVEFELDGQQSGAEDDYAVQTIQNTASATKKFTTWDKNGDADPTGEVTTNASANTHVPDVEAPEISITKKAVNKSDSSRNTARNAVLNDTIEYTLKLENVGDLGMKNPYVFDLLPRGLDYDSATADEFAAHVKISTRDDHYDTENPEIQISRVIVIEGQQGYKALQIELTGELKAHSYIEITLQGTVGTSIINYLADSMALSNHAYITSREQGPIYGGNDNGAAFKGDTGVWSGNLNTGADGNKYDNALAAILEGRFNGHGYQSAYDDLTFVSNNQFGLMKETTGDLDPEDTWYSGNNVAHATANVRSSDNDDSSNGDDSAEESEGGWAKFRLTLDNKDMAVEIVTPVVLDIIPKKGDNYDLLGSQRGSKWSLDFDSIESIIIEDRVQRDGSEDYDIVQMDPLSPDQYKVWYYTGDITADMTADGDGSEIGVMLKDYLGWMNGSETVDPDPNAFANKGWVESVEDGQKGSITAFIVVVTDQDVRIKGQCRMMLTYKTTVSEMEESELAETAHANTKNTFSTYYKYTTPGDSYDNAVSARRVLTSNIVAVQLETKPVSVGGMFWIDADGDGFQDDEDVTAIGGPEAKFNARTNKYGNYKAVQELLKTVTITLMPTTGYQDGTTEMQTASQAVASGVQPENLFRFQFDGLTTASSAEDPGQLYNANGVDWTKLAGGATAKTYVLQANIPGGIGVKYALTIPRQNINGQPEAQAVWSISPSDLYETESGNYFNNVLRDSNFTGSTDIVTSGLSALSERFYVHAISNPYDLSKDIGLVLYRDLEITKQDEQGNQVNGAEFTVYGPFAVGEAIEHINDTDEELEGAQKKFGSDTTENGKVTFEDLLYFQEYIIKETVTPDGYNREQSQLDETSFNAEAVGTKTWILHIPKEDGTGTLMGNPTSSNLEDVDHVKITNYPSRGSIKFTKTEYEADPDEEIYVSGAKFELHNVSTTVEGIWQGWVANVDGLSADAIAAMGIGNVRPISREVENSDPSADPSAPKVYEYWLEFETAFTESVTQVTFSNLPVGTYTLTETAAAPGYELKTPRSWTIEVTETGARWTPVSLDDGDDDDQSDDLFTDGETPDIDNKYAPEGNLILKASKTETNYNSVTAPDGKYTYTFKAYKADENWDTEGDPVEATVSGEGTVDFVVSDDAEVNIFHFDAPGTYYYVVEEVIPETDAQRHYVTYDPAKYRITVEVADTQDHNGTLEATITSVKKLADGTPESAADVTLAQGSTTFVSAFENIYEPKGEFFIPIRKQVTDGAGHVYEDDKRNTEDLKFVFTLNETGVGDIGQITLTGAQLFGKTEKNGLGDFVFTDDTLLDAFKGHLKFTYDDIGWEHTYTITEEVEKTNNGTYPDGYANNNESYIITITPTDDGEGHVVVLPGNVTVTKNGVRQPVTEVPFTSGFVFTNVYSPKGSTYLAMKKTLNGSTTMPDAAELEFRVHIVQLETDSDGNPVADGDGYAFSKDDISGGMDAMVQPDGVVSFVPDRSTEIPGTISGYPAVYQQLKYTKAGTYWYLVTESDPIYADGSVEPELPGEGGENPGAGEGESKQYKIDSTQYFVKIVMKDEGTGALSLESITVYKDNPVNGDEVGNSQVIENALFKNLTVMDYSATKLWLEENGREVRHDFWVDKVISVQLRRRPVGSDESSWENVGNRVYMKASVDTDDGEEREPENGENWSAIWEDLEEYDDDGNQYEYQVVEIGDDDQPLENGKIQGDYGTEFTVEYDRTSDPRSTSIINRLNNGAIQITKVHAGKGYTGEETYQYTVEFWMEDGDDEQLALVNEYPYMYLSTQSPPEGYLRSGSTFNLKAGETIIIYQLPVGTQYRITETASTDYSYSTSVTVDGEATPGEIAMGKISDESDQNDPGSTVEYENYYATGELVLRGTKDAENMPEARTFTFDLYEEVNGPEIDGEITKLQNLLQSKTINVIEGDSSDNGFIFDAIEYTLSSLGGQESRTYVYWVKETIPGNTNGYTYDPSEYKITVEVKDNGRHEGELTATIQSIEKYVTQLVDDELKTEKVADVDLNTGITFTNRYDATGSLLVSAVKNYNGDSDGIETGMFTFTLTRGSVTGNVFTADSVPDTLPEGETEESYTQTKSANPESMGNAAGIIPFEEIQYTQADNGREYWYQIKENANPNYDCDDIVYYVKVTVSDNKQGSMEVAKAFYKGTLTGPDMSQPIDGTNNVTFEFNNYDMVSFQVRKVWVGGTDNDWLDEVYVILQRTTPNSSEWETVDLNGDGAINAMQGQNDGQDMRGDVVKLNGGNQWTYRWNQTLPKNVFGHAEQEYSYRAVEVVLTDTDPYYRELTAEDLIDAKSGNGRFTASYEPIDYETPEIPGVPEAVVYNTLGGDIRITKQAVNNQNPDMAFSFTAVFYKDTTKSYADQYSYQIYETVTVDNQQTKNVVKSGVFYMTSGVPQFDFELKEGQTIEFLNLPIGTTYRITENNVQDGYNQDNLPDRKPDIVFSPELTVGNGSNTFDGSGLTDNDPVSASTVTNTYKAFGEMTLPVHKLLDYGATTIQENAFEFVLTDAIASYRESAGDVDTPGEAGGSTVLSKGTNEIAKYVDASTVVEFDFSYTDTTGECNTDAGIDHWYILSETQADTRLYVSDARMYAIRVNVRDVGETVTAQDGMQTQVHNGRLDTVATVYELTKNADGTYTVGAELGEPTESLPQFENTTLTEVSVIKKWEGDENVWTTARPESIWVAMERRVKKESGTPDPWELLTQTPYEPKELTGDQSVDAQWSMTWTHLPAKAKIGDDVVTYEYRIVEVIKENDVWKAASALVGVDDTNIYAVRVENGTITNSLRKEDLKIGKTVEGEDTDKDDKTFSFTATFKIGDDVLTGTYQYEIYDVGATGDTLAQDGTGSFTLNEGTATFTLGHNQYIVIKRLPYGTTYEVTESGYDGFCVSWAAAANAQGVGTFDPETPDTAGGSLTADTGAVNAGINFINRKIKELTISKSQTGGTVNDVFTVTVNVKAAGETAFTAYEGPYTITHNGVEDERETEDGTIAFMNGDVILIKLPYGYEYEVIETQKTGYRTPAYMVNGTAYTPDTDETGVKGTIGGDTQIEVANVYETGKLVISKVAVGGYADAVFTFKVNLGIAANDLKTSFDVVYTDENGAVIDDDDLLAAKVINLGNDNTVGNVVLRDGWTATLEGIDVGKLVTVEEIYVSSANAGVTNGDLDANQYDTTIGGESGKTYSQRISTDNAEYKAEYENTYREGSVTVMKTVTSITGKPNMDKVFTFTLTLRDTTNAIGLEGTYQYMKGTAAWDDAADPEHTDEANRTIIETNETFTLTAQDITTDPETGETVGTFTFTLMDGEYVTFTFPDRFAYNVTESPDNAYKVNVKEGSVTSLTDTTGGTIASGHQSSVEFINDYRAKGSAKIEAFKQLGGETLVKNMFSFVLYDEYDNPIQFTGNNDDGSVVFLLEYTEQDLGQNNTEKTFTYKIRETDSEKPGIIYDDTVYTVIVKVKDAGEGVLATTVEYVDTDLPWFINEFSGDVTLIKKGDDGRLLEGAIFELYRQNDQVADMPMFLPMGRYVTNSDGVIYVKNLEAGHYSFKEIEPPVGYFLPDNVVYEFTIGMGEDATVHAQIEVENKRDYSYFFEGELTITKQVVDKSGDLYPSYETFYVGIFEDEAFTTLSDKVSSNIVALNMSGKPDLSVTVHVELPEDEDEWIDLYVTEVDADGKPVDGAAGFVYTVTQDKTDVHLKRRIDGRAEVTITNKAPWETAKLRIIKNTLYHNTGYAVEHTFYVALFEDEPCTKRVTNVQELVFDRTTVAVTEFAGLIVGKTYYVAETDADGNAIQNGRITTGKGEDLFTVRFPQGNEVSVSTKETLEFSFNNVFTKPGVDDVPMTGDDSHIGMWFGMMIVSLAGLLGYLFAVKKRALRRG